MVYIDLKKCTGCGTCTKVCPVDAISIVEGTARIEQEKCLDCEACVKVCPNEAILAVRESVLEQATEPGVHLAPEVIQVRPQAAPAPQQARLVPFIESALAFLGRNIAPRLATYLLNAPDQQPGPWADFAAKGRGFRRRRRRGWGGQ